MYGNNNYGAGGYGQPQQNAYGAPQQQYGAPQQQYGAPQQAPPPYTPSQAGSGTGTGSASSYYNSSGKY